MRPAWHDYYFFEAMFTTLHGYGLHPTLLRTGKSQHAEFWVHSHAITYVDLISRPGDECMAVEPLAHAVLDDCDLVFVCASACIDASPIHFRRQVHAVDQVFHYDESPVVVMRVVDDRAPCTRNSDADSNNARCQRITFLHARSPFGSLRANHA